jgi:dCTP deaminase
MAYLGSEKLKEIIESKKVISPAPDSSKLSTRIKQGAYELSLGNEVFETDSNDGKKRKLTQEKEQVVINPGQFALLLTEESIYVPNDKIAFISIKARIKLRGLVNVSGFHVDPGFNGKLLFSVYNAGSGPISLERGAPCFLIWFAELDVPQSDTDHYDGKHQGLDSIPPEYIDHLNKSELASPNILLDKINKNYDELSSITKTRDYIVKTCLGILVVIALKFLWDWSSYDKGKSEGFKEGRNLVEMEIELNDLLNQKKRLLLQIDSLERKKERILNEPQTE